RSRCTARPRSWWSASRGQESPAQPRGPRAGAICAWVHLVMCCAVMLRPFFHLSGAVFGPAAACAFVFFFRGEFENASIAVGIAAAAFTYWIAFYTRRDTR